MGRFIGPSPESSRVCQPAICNSALIVGSLGVSGKGQEIIGVEGWGALHTAMGIIFIHAGFRSSSVAGILCIPSPTDLEVIHSLLPQWWLWQDLSQVCCWNNRRRHQSLFLSPWVKEFQQHPQGSPLQAWSAAVLEGCGTFEKWGLARGSVISVAPLYLLFRLPPCSLRWTQFYTCLLGHDTLYHHLKSWVQIHSPSTKFLFGCSDKSMN